MKNLMLSVVRTAAKENEDEDSPDPARKFALVDSQIRRVALGRAESLDCPYCLSSVKVGVDRLCCASMGEATATVLQTMEAERSYKTDSLDVFASGLKFTVDAWRGQQHFRRG